MKRVFSILGGFAIAIAITVPARAQSQGDAKFNRFLSNHPQINSDIQKNPSLLYNENYQKSHQPLYQYLMQHPGVTHTLQQEHKAGTGFGAYDQNHQWQNADWWHQNNPNWMHQNHPEWTQNHPEWRDDGDFDNQHKWHDRNWWSNNDPKWGKNHHPNWYKHEEHAERKEHHEELKEHHEEMKEHHHHDHGHEAS